MDDSALAVEICLEQGLDPAAPPVVVDGYRQQHRLHLILLARFGFDRDRSWVSIQAALSESRKMRVQQQVRSRLSSFPLRRWAWLAVAALLVMGVFLIWQRQGHPHTAQVVEAQAVCLARSGQALRPAVPGEPVRRDDRLVVASGGRATVRFADGTTVVLGADTEVRLTGDDLRKRLDLVTGRLEASVQPQPSRSGFAVVASGTEATVIGTRFGLSTVGDSAWLRVDEGLVCLATATQRQVIAAGDRAISRQGSLRTLPPAPAPVIRDHRPIGSVHFTQSDGGTLGNPRFWFDNTTLDLRTPQGKAAFRQQVLDRVDACLANLRRIDAQGLLFYDLEGRQGVYGRPPYYYHARPRDLPRLAPEMDAIADEVLARVRKAGFRVGLPLAMPVGMDADAAALDLSDSIRSAQQRWGADFFVILGEAQAADGTDLLDLLHRACPEVLLLSEKGRVEHCAWALPRLGPSRSAWPDILPPGKVGYLDLADMKPEWSDRLAAAIAAGHIVQIDCWYESPTFRFLLAPPASRP